MFGHEDVIRGRPYSSTVHCVTTEGSLYCIRASEFLHKMGKDERTWNILEQMTNI